MARVEYPRKLLEKSIPLKSNEIEQINNFGLSVEAVEQDIIALEVLPNRPDLLSAQGLIRSLRAFFGKEQGLKKYKVNKPESNYKVIVDSSVSTVRPYTVCAIVRGLSYSDEFIKEVIDLQEKLHTTLGRNRKRAAIGIYPLENIKLPIRYEARNPKDILFRPLESEREMSGLEILRIHPTGKEFAHLLEKNEKFPVFIDHSGRILSMPPIINSHDTGRITSNTRDVFIECSGYSLPVLEKILAIITTTLADAGGKIYSMLVEYGKTNKIETPDLSPKKMKISLNNANALLGTNFKEKDLEKLLPRMGYDYKSGSVYVPSWRTDILHEVDIIEDLAIAFGYENIEATLPDISTIGEESIESRKKNKIADILIGLGMLENSTYHLIKEGESKLLKISEPIELENAKTEYKILRSNLLIPALRILAENKDNEYPQNIFELGTIFKRNKDSETGVEEREHLIISLAPGNFTRLKQVLDYLSNCISFKYELEETKKEGFIEGRTASIKIGGKNLGFMGEAHPELLRSWNIKIPLAVLEIDISDLIRSQPK